MIVTHITSAHPRYDVRIFLKECSSLAANGHTVNVIVSDGKGNEQRNKVNIIDAGAKPSNRMARMTATVRSVYSKAISTKADIYHLHDPELLTLVPFLLKRGKVIYDAHEDLPRQILGKHWIPKQLRFLISFLAEKIENFYARRVSGIITATPFIAKRFKKINPSVENINNFPRLEEFKDIQRQPSRENIACYIGGISSIRGIFEMVRAMEHVNGKLLLAGTFSTQEERQIAQTLPGWGKGVELGFCDRTKVKEILASARVGLVLFHPLQNHLDALPNKLFEYMAAGLPVIASDFPLWKDIVNSAACGMCVDPLDTIQITDAINLFLDNPEKASEMGSAGKRAVEEQYNWKREEKKLLEFFRSI